ncbi:unnamed protein product, partial [Scytosiphon promiscuus]
GAGDGGGDGSSLGTVYLTAKAIEILAMHPAGPSGCVLAALSVAIPCTLLQQPQLHQHQQQLHQQQYPTSGRPGSPNGPTTPLTRVSGMGQLQQVSTATAAMHAGRNRGVNQPKHSTPGNLGQLSVGRPPATPKPSLDDVTTGGVNLGSGRIQHKRYSGGGGGGGSGELYPATPADAGPGAATGTTTSASIPNAIPVAGTALSALDSSDSATPGAGLVLWPSATLARGAAGGSGGVGSSSSRVFTPVSGGSIYGIRRQVTPQDGARQLEKEARAFAMRVRDVSKYAWSEFAQLARSGDSFRLGAAKLSGAIGGGGGGGGGASALGIAAARSSSPGLSPRPPGVAATGGGRNSPALGEETGPANPLQATFLNRVCLLDIDDKHKASLRRTWEATRKWSWGYEKQRRCDEAAESRAQVERKERENARRAAAEEEEEEAKRAAAAAAAEAEAAAAAAAAAKAQQAVSERGTNRPSAAAAAAAQLPSLGSFPTRRSAQ